MQKKDAVSRLCEVHELLTHDYRQAAIACQAAIYELQAFSPSFLSDKEIEAIVRQYLAIVNFLLNTGRINETLHTDHDVQLAQCLLKDYASLLAGQTIDESSVFLRIYRNIPEFLRALINWLSTESTIKEQIRLGPLLYSPQTGTLYLESGSTIHIRPADNRAFLLLVRSLGRVVHKGEFCSGRNYIYGDDKYVRIGINYLRNQLKSVQHILQIETVHGFGYKLVLLHQDSNKT